MAETSNLTVKRCALVTGGNKGIGLEICRKLAANGITVILTARNEQKGREAVEKLKASGLLDVLFHQLDIKEPASIAALANFVEINFRKLDIQVNRAMTDTNNLMKKRCARVTGGNKGIGLETCRKLAANGITVILTARNEINGREAVEKLNVAQSKISWLEVSDVSSTWL